jgi:methanogenic corrinoid protein MtbC1
MPDLYVSGSSTSPAKPQPTAGSAKAPTRQPRPRRTKKNKADCVHLLTRMVEGEIVPRLLLSHSVEAGAAPSPSPSPSPVESSLVEDFAQLAITREADVLMDYLEALLARGVTVQSLYIDLLAPTARRLGDWWTADVCSFTEVTIGLGRLQHVLHELSRRTPVTHDPKKRSRAVLFAAAPGEQHTFGLLVVEEFFRRAGWQTWCELSGVQSDVQRAAASQHYDLFGMSVSCDSHLDRVASMITTVKRSSRNRAIRVMVGGRLFNERPDLVAGVGADVMASDGSEAVAKASAVCQLECRHS